GDRVLHSHLRMRGAWHVYREGERWRRTPHDAWLVLTAAGRVAVLFHGPVLELLDGRRLRTHPVLSRLGPDVLAADFDARAAVARARRTVDRRVAVGELVLDQRVACGIGNVYKSEALHAERVDPFAPIGALPDELLASVYEQARRQMLA